MFAGPAANPTTRMPLPTSGLSSAAAAASAARRSRWLPHRRRRSQSTVRSVDCPHMLGSLPCMNQKPHEGNGRGCVHHSTSGFRDDE